MQQPWPTHDIGPMVVAYADHLHCTVCHANCPNTSKERARFEKRHPAKCQERREFTKQLAEGVRSVDADGWREAQADYRAGEDGK